MNLILTQRRPGEVWECDCPDLSGSPPVGFGVTREMAVAAWFMCNADYVSEHRFEPLMIDGELWSNPGAAER